MRRNFFRRLTAFALVLMMALSLAACGNNNSTPDNTSNPGTTTPDTTTPNTSSTDGKQVEAVQAGEKTSLTSDETVTIALNGEPNKLIPDFGFVSNTVSAVCKMMYEPLIDAEWPWNLNKNGLVTDWEYIDDTHLRLTLREGVKFSSGDEFNADDVLYMFQNGSPALYYDCFVGSECYKEDDYHVVLVAVQPWGQLVSMLSTQNFQVISSKAMEAAGGAQTDAQYVENAGTGKYVFKEWVPGEYILLERNENYWNQEDPGYFKEVKFVFLSDTTANGLAAQSGAVDIASSPSLANYAVYEADSNVKIAFVNSENVSTLFLNSGKGGPCADLNVRKAIQCLVDPAALREVGQYGYGTLCDTIISPKNPAHDGINESAERKIDIDKAKEYLAEAGYADGLTLSLRGSSDSVVNQMIQEQLRQGGIEVNIIVADTPTHFAALAEGDYDMYVSSQQAMYYSEPLRCCDGIGWDYAALMGGCGYKDEAWHELTLKILTCTDEAERTELLKEYQAGFRENVISIPLYTGCAITVTRPDIEGISLFGLGALDFTHIYSSKG